MNELKIQNAFASEAARQLPVFGGTRTQGRFCVCPSQLSVLEARANHSREAGLIQLYALPYFLTPASVLGATDAATCGTL
jgi:hypothetical protein